MRRILALLLLLSSGSLLAQAKPKIVCWNDDQGVRHCGDRVPPEYAKTDRERLDAQGRVISTQARELTAEELAEKKRAEEAAALEAQRRKEAEAYDRFLLQSFTLPEDILSARDERLRILDGRIRLADEGVAENERTLDTLRSQLQAPELKAGPERARLDQQLQSFELSLVDQLKGAAALRAERETLCANAAADLKRFGELRKLTTSEPACPAIGSLVEEGMASEDQVPEGAKALVARLQTLERSFDPGLLDLYAVDATITNRRKGKDGKPVDTVVALDKHRSTLTAALKKAQPKNQPRTYSRIRYAPLSGGRYKLTAERVDAPKAKPVTVMMLLVPQPDESWKIQREIVETR